MRANEFIKLLEDEEELMVPKDEFWIEYYDEIITVVKNVWKRKYPDVKLHDTDSFENGDAGFEFNTNPDHQGYTPENDGFTLNFGCQLFYKGDSMMSDNNIFYIVVSNAYSGKYKGVVVDMLDAVYRFMESKLQEYVPGSNRAEFKRMIGIHHNRNQEAWSNIARKLGAVEEPRGYDQ